MSKFLRTAALVVGGIALAATGIGAGLAVAEGISYASAAGFVAGAMGGVSVAALGAAATALSAVSSLLQKKPQAVGNPMQWQADPQAGIPIIAGRTYSAGKIVYRQTSGDTNKWEAITTVHSIGPVQSFDQLYVDGVATSVGTDTTVNITDRGNMFERHQLGAQPEASALQVGQGGYPPGIDATSKLSGLAASAIQLVYDTKGTKTLTTEPQCGYVIQGVRVYDPRQDSTYPGGSGPQRWNDETTWSYTGKDNPYLFALAWLIGWRQNGKLVAGVGAPIAAILLDQFVEGANIADANSWKMGGILQTTDNKWQRLKDILLAGGGEPLRLGAQIGCLINTPRVSLATIGIDDVIGDASVQSTQAMRDRINAVVPRYMAEQSLTTQNADGTLRTAVTWGMAAAGPIVIDSYVTFDGKQRQTQIDYEFVQGVGGGPNAPNQVAQLARYAIENAREFGPISLPLKLRWMGYKPGDVVTANLPELGLVNQDILLLNRSLDPSKGAVTMTARSETYAKHAFALGQTTTAPPTPSVSGPPLIPTPGPSEWEIAADAISANGTTIPALVLSGAPAGGGIDRIVFEYRPYAVGQGEDAGWIAGGVEVPSTLAKVITGLQDNTQYDASVRYLKGPSSGGRLILGPTTVSSTAVPWSGITGSGKPEDGATVGAPPGTPVGGRPAEQVISDLDLNGQNWFALAQTVAANDAIMLARTTLNGQQIGTVLTTFQQQYQDSNTAIVEDLSLIGAKSGDGTAIILNLSTVRVGPNTSLNDQFTNFGNSITSLINATNGLAASIDPTNTSGVLYSISQNVTTLQNQYAGVSGSVTSLQQVIVGSDGSVAARAILSLNANGRVAGIVATNNGETSTLEMVFGAYNLLGPDGTSLFFATGNTVHMPNVVVETIKVGSGGTSSAPTFTSAGSSIGGQGSGTYFDLITMNVTLDEPGTILADFFAAQSFPSGDKTWNARLLIDGVTVFACGGEKTADSISLGGALARSAGTYVVKIQYAADNTVSVGNRILRAWGIY